MKTIALSVFALTPWAAPAVAVSEGSRFLQDPFDSNCTSIREIICGSIYPTDLLCDALEMAGIDDELEDDIWTVFAPTNDAFDNIPEEIAELILSDPSNDENRELVTILALHVFPGVALKSTDLKCDGKILMANEEYTVTICEGDRMYQMGPGNLVTDYPEIIVENIEACNGMVHLISEVLLFDDYSDDGNSTETFEIQSDDLLDDFIDDANFTTVTGIPSDTPSDRPTMEPSSVPSSLPSDGPSLEPSVLPSDLPSDGPSMEPSGTPSDLPSDGPSLEPSGVPSDLPSDGPSLEPSTLPSDGPSMDPSIEPTPAPSGNPTSPTTAPSEDPTKIPTPDPCSIHEIACDSEDFSYLCAAMTATGLNEPLDDYSGNYTVFAPSDAAVEKLGDVAIAYLFAPENVELLGELVAFHVVEDQVLYSSDLECQERTEMSNGKDSRTVCKRESFYQKGKGNSDEDRPEIVEVDIEACNGVIHVVDELMLFDFPEELGIPPKGATFAPTGVAFDTSFPTPRPTFHQTSDPSSDLSFPSTDVAPTAVGEDCKTVDQLLCDDPDFSILCDSLEMTGLADALADGNWTVFAPINEAFLKLPPNVVRTLTTDHDLLSNLLLFHVVEDEILYQSDLPCVAGENLITMGNGKDSRTLCKDVRPGVPAPRFQKGKENPKQSMPAFLEFDLEACNGVVHELDGVLQFRKIGSDGSE